MKKNKWLLSVSLLLMVVLVFHTARFPLAVYAGVGSSSSSGSSSSGLSTQELQDRLTELQNAQRNIRAQIEGYNEAIQAGNNAAQAAQARKAALEQERALIEEQIELKLQQIEEMMAQIEVKAAEIAQKQQEFDENDRLFRSRLVAIYKMNDASILSTLLSVNSFSEFLSIAKYLQNISIHDTELLEMLESQRASLEAAKAELEALLAGLEEERVLLDAKWEELNQNVNEAQAQYSQAMQQIAQAEQSKANALAEIEAMQAEMEGIWQSLGGSKGAYIGGELAWPVPSHNGSQYVSSTFGWRTLYGRPNFHKGVDIARGPTANINGADIVAANGGEVVLVVANSNTGYGNYTIIDHGDGIKTLYAHCSAIYVHVGQTVSRGATIAAVGNTGNSTGPHLHFELRLNNTEVVDPWPYLTGAKSLD